MPRAPHIEDRLAEIDLRILLRLYETWPESYDLPFTDAAGFPLSAVEENEVLVRLLKLKRNEWIEGEPNGIIFMRAQLMPETKERLDQIIPGARVNFLERARETLHECDANTVPAGKRTADRDAILDRPLGIARIYEPPTSH